MAERPVVWISHRAGERCAGCAAEVFRRDFVQITGETGIRCAKCAGLADLVYLPAGDPALTRRAVAHSSRAVTVVKFSRARGRHESQGMLVEETVLQRAQAECAADAARREAARARRRPREERAEHEYLVRFTERVLERFPGCRNGPGRPAVAPEIRALIRRMSKANPLWGAPRIVADPFTLTLVERSAHPSSARGLLSVERNGGLC